MEETENYARDALASFRRIRNRAGIFSCYNKLAWVHFVRGDYENSAKYLRDAIESLRSHAERNEKAAISLTRYSANLARVHILTGEWDEAADLLEKCIEQNKLYNVKRSLILNLLSLGYLCVLKRNQRQAWYCFEEVRQLLGRDRHYRREQAILREYLGRYYTEFGEYAKAHEVLSDGISEAEAIAPESSLLAQLCRYRADASIGLEQFDDAIRDAERALAIAESIGEKVEVAHSLRIIGVAMFRLDQKKTGAEYLKKSEEVFSGLSDKFDKALALLDFARVSFVRDSEYEYRRAQAHIITARSVFKKMGVRFYDAESWLVEAELHKRSGKYDLALRCQPNS